jgi:hypothetical protein
MSAATGPKRRMRLWAGIAILGIGSYLIGGVDKRLELAGDLLKTWWPWVLLALAAINLGRAIVRVESMIAPGLLAMAAIIGLAIGRPEASPTIINLAIPAALILVGAVLALSYSCGTSDRWVRVLTSGRVHINDQVPQEITVWAIAGELSLDLGGAELDTTQEVTIAVNVILGHVHLDIPRNWPIHLPAEPHSDRLVLTRIRDIGVRSQQEGDYGATLHLFGFCGAITLLRH